MRTFSEEEKKVIKRLIEGRNLMADLIDFADFEGYLIDYEIDPYSGINEISVLVYESVGMEVATQRFEEFQISIARTLNLISYLISENYLFGIQTAHGKSVKGQIGAIEELKRYKATPNSYRIKIPLPENFLRPAIIQFLDQRIVTTKALEEFHNNGFQSKEEKHNQRTYNISVLALVTAIIIGIASIIIGLCGK